MSQQLLSDEEVFGVAAKPTAKPSQIDQGSALLSDEEVFGVAAKPTAKPKSFIDKATDAVAGVFSGSDAPGGGRGSINPPTVDPSAPRPPQPRQPKPYRNRLEALDDAVNLVEEGADPSQVSASFGNLGIQPSEIEQHGMQRGSQAFQRQTISPQDASRAMAAKPSGSIKASPAPRERTALEAVSDTGLQLKSGVYNLAGAVPQLVAPEGDAAQFFQDQARKTDRQQSGPMRDRMAIADSAISEAGQDGLMSQMAEAAAQYFSEPALAARFVATNLPSMVPGIGAAKVAQVASLAKGLSAASAARNAMIAGGAVNAALNAGGARGESFDDIKRTLVAQGMSDEAATEAALRDSRVAAAVGAITGALSGATGLEGVVAKSGSVLAKGGARKAAKEAGIEFLGEQLEEVAPKVATNIMAGQYDNRPVTQDVGRTIVETAIGSAPGAAMAAGGEIYNDPTRQIAREIDRGAADVGRQIRAQTDPSMPQGGPTAWDIARSKGFNVEPPTPADKPSVRRSKAVDMLTELGAMAGLPKNAIDAALRASENKPADALPGFFARFARNLHNKGVVQIDPDVLAAMESPYQQAATAMDAMAPDAQQRIADIEAGATGLADESQPSIVVPTTTPETMNGDQMQASEPVASEVPTSLSGAKENESTGLATTTIGQAAAAPQPSIGQADSQAAPTLATAVDQAAHQAATSPTNDLNEPTQGQKEAGNYKVGRTRVAGMDISIENPEGSVRRGVDQDGKEWTSPMRAHYGYFAGTEAADGDKLDVFIKPGTAEDWRGPVFVIDQVDQKTGKLDEHKVVFGAQDEAEAEAIYRSNYDANWNGFGDMTRLPLPAFKAWAKSGRLKEPLGDITKWKANNGKTGETAQPIAGDGGSGPSDTASSASGIRYGADVTAGSEPSGTGLAAVSGKPGGSGGEIAPSVPEAESGRDGGALNAVAGDKIDDEWTAFKPESGTLAIPRADMPQVKAEHRGAMTNFLNARGIEHESDEVPASSLKPTQAEFAPAKVDKAKEFTGGNRSILVSEDGHVADGHHQWLSKLDKDEPVKVIRLKAPIKDLLEHMKEFPSSEVSDGAESVRGTNEAMPESTKPGPNGEQRTGADQGNAVTKRFKGFGPQDHYTPSQNLSATFEPAGIKVKESGSSASGSRYVELNDPVSGEVFTVRFADHKATGRAIALHGVPTFEVGDFDGADFKTWKEAAAASLDRINEARREYGDPELSLNDQSAPDSEGAKTTASKEVRQQTQPNATGSRRTQKATDDAGQAGAIEPVGPWRTLVGGNEVRTNKDGITVRHHDRIVHIRGADSIAAAAKSKELATSEIRELHHIGIKDNPKDPFSEATIWLNGDGHMVMKKGSIKPVGSVAQILKTVKTEAAAAPDAEAATEVSQQAQSVGTTGEGAGGSRSTPAAPENKNPARRVIGRTGKTPTSAQNVELRSNKDETLTPWVEGYEILDFETGEPLSLPADVTDEQAIEAIKSAGSMGRGTKFYATKQEGADDAPMFSLAYHGTPHRGIEKFSTDKIGTGEGAQAYGWGLYFASKREVAEYYRKGLSWRNVVRQFRDALPDDASLDEAMEAAESGELNKPMTDVVKALAADDWLGFDYPAQAIQAAFKQLDAYDPSPELREAVRNYGGQIYAVDIPEDSEMLHWDKPLGEQPKTVQNALRKGYEEQGSDYPEKSATPKTGRDVYQDFRALAGGLETMDQQAASEYLASLGIKGIKYLDGTSRSAGDGSYNYVIFSGDDVQVQEAMYSRTTDPLFRLDSPDAFGQVDAAISRVDLAEVVKRNLDGWRGVGIDSIVAADDWRGLPPEIQQSAFDQGKHPSQIEGVYFKGKVYLVRAKLRDKTHAEEVLFHEAVGHMGTRLALEGKPTAALNELWTKLNGLAGVSKLAKKIQLQDGKTAWDRLKPYVDGMTDDQVRRRATIMDELIAFIAQSNDTSPLTQFKAYMADLKAAMVKLARKLGLNSIADRLDKAGAELEVIQLVRDARRAITTGKTRTGQQFVIVGSGSAQPAMSLSRQGDGGGGDVSFSLSGGASAKNEAPQKRPMLAGRDELGRWRIEPGQRLYERLGKVASPLLKALQLQAASPELRRQLRTMKLQVDKAMRTATTVAEPLFKLSDEDRGLLSDIIESELSAGVIPPSHAVNLADKISKIMTQQTDELVRLGMLSKDSAEQWRGHYLPRFYRSKLRHVADPWMKAIRSALGKPSTMQGIKGASLKGRGLWEVVPANDVADWEALGWTIRDQDYERGKSEDVRMWRDFTKPEREKMGEIRDAGFRFVMGYLRTQRDVALGNMFEGMASDPRMASKVEREGWVQVPDTNVQNTMGVKRYGKLSGMWVPNEVLSHLTQFDEADRELLSMYRKALGMWKEGKTVLNPVSHMNNVLSNLSVAHFAGVSYWDVHKYVGAARDMIRKGGVFKEALDVGLFLGTLSQEDLLNQMPKQLQEIANIQESAGKKAVSKLYGILTFGMRRPMGKAYEFEDLFFRFLIYRDARSNGLDPANAVDYAQRYVFTYDDLPKGARRVRDFAMPFFSYTYKSVPMLLQTALTTPWRLIAPASVLWGLNALFYAMQTDDDDDWLEKIWQGLTDEQRRSEIKETQSEERKYLPPWLKGRTALGSPKAVRIWEDNVTGLPMFWDVSRIIPGGDMFDSNPGTDGAMPLLAPLTPSHPLLSTAAAMLANRDLFTGRDLVDINDANGEAAQKRLAWVWKQVAPAIAFGSYHWDRALNAAAYATQKPIELGPLQYTGIGKDGLPVQPGLAALQTIGIKIRPIDLELSQDIEQGQKNKLIRSIDAEMRQLQRLYDNLAVTDEQLEKAQDAADLKRERLLDGQTVDGDPIYEDEIDEGDEGDDDPPE